MVPGVASSRSYCVPQFRLDRLLHKAPRQDATCSPQFAGSPDHCFFWLLNSPAWFLNENKTSMFYLTEILFCFPLNHAVCVNNVYTSYDNTHSEFWQRINKVSVCWYLMLQTPTQAYKPWEYSAQNNLSFQWTAVAIRTLQCQVTFFFYFFALRKEITLFMLGVGSKVCEINWM